MRSASGGSVFFFRSLFSALALMIALVLATPGFAQVSFNPSVHSSPNIPNDIFQVKLNQLGKPDLIITQAGSNSVSVFLNDGNGNFPAGPSATYLTGGVATNSVAAADFNEDGFPDLATATAATPLIRRKRLFHQAFPSCLIMVIAPSNRTRITRCPRVRIQSAPLSRVLNL